MPPYAQHVVVRTGMDDWASRIEEEEEEEKKEEAGRGVNFVRGLKELVGRGGRFFDVCMDLVVWLVGWIRSCFDYYWWYIQVIWGMEREREREREEES